MYIDFFKDFGLNIDVKGTGVENVIISYVIDSSSSSISKGNIVSFINNSIRKMQSGDSPRAIALQNGIVGDTIKCQLLGIVKISDFFIPGANYFNTETGELSSVTVTPSGNIKHIGIAISNDELLIKRGAFIYV